LLFTKFVLDAVVLTASYRFQHLSNPQDPGTNVTQSSQTQTV